MRNITNIMLFLLVYNSAFSQGLNHQWLLGYATSIDSFSTSQKARLIFDMNNVTVVPEIRKIKFLSGQANIADSLGNLLAASNGIWIANSNNDTMMNGSGLNPNPFTSSWVNFGIPYVHSNVMLPWPDVTNQIALFHMTGNNASPFQLWSSEIYYSIIDMNLDGGLGGVTQKNLIAIQDLLCPGVGACRHANGRDWWVSVLKDSSDIIYKILLTPMGISSVTSQQLNVPHHNRYNGQPQFSPDGNKFAYLYYSGPVGNHNLEVRLFDFNRCDGTLSNPRIINISDTYAGFGLSFSPDSKLLYAASFQNIYQMAVDSPSVTSTVQLVAANDGFFSPVSPFQTDFWHMYLAANGKIYISSGSSVIDLHYINFPDSAGIACDVQQHALHLPCYSGRGNVYHPNYYLGCDITSVCPCLTTGENEPQGHDFKFSVSPNPASEIVKIIYLLPQNEKGKLEVFDINGRRVYEMSLPPWSTLQQEDVSFLSGGVYNCMVSSGGFRVGKKLVVIRE